MNKLAVFFFVIACTTFSASIGGLVTDSYGIPESGFSLTLTNTGTFPPPPPMIEYTGADGTYIFTGLDASTYTITPSSPIGVTPPSYTGITVSSATDSLAGYDFRLSLSTTDALIGGVVTYLGGLPASGIDIMGISGMSVFSAITDSVGYYEIAVSSEDSIYLMCAPPDSFTPDPAMYTISILPGDTILDYDFVLSPIGFDTSYSITTMVFDTTGIPVDDVLIQCREISGTSPWMSDYTSDGEVTFSLSEAGDYVVQPLAAGYYFDPEIDTVAITPSSPTASLLFTMYDSSAISPYWIHAEVTDTTGTPFDSVFIEWKHIDDMTWNPGWSSGGIFSAHVPDSGIYDMRASVGIPGMIVLPAETTLHLTESSPEDTAHFTVRADTSAISEDKVLQPFNFAIYTHPNPFNSSVTISVEQTFLSVHETGDGQTGMSGLPMQVEIYDVAGRLVAVLENKHQPVISRSDSDEKSRAVQEEISRQARNDRLGNGRYDSQNKFIWTPAPSLPSGVYLVRARFDPSASSGLRMLSDQGGCERVARLVYLK